ncbi:acetyl-CoA carboxylase, carboxyltransferase subunit beta [Mycoplasmatota bacterium]|nr:acetyl-CoA carboxylase, carboxyltransferase subunit beta [Mycoplasmatota bacterium]
MSVINRLEEKRLLRKRYKESLKRFSKSKVEIPDGLYDKCNKCGEMLLKEDIVENSFTCSKCGDHFRMRAVDRIKLTVDEGSFYEKGFGFITLNPLDIDNYDDKIDTLNQKTGLDDAYIYGHATIDNNPCVVGVMDSYFLMGSMGSVVGEKVTKSFEYAMYKKLPLILFTASGGARMQEGILSLMQMVKTSQVVSKFHEMGLLYVTVLTHPTTGGVTASFAMLGDIHLAEPNALIGFAGPRVIEQIIKQKLPEEFQKSEFLKERGFVDKVVHRKDMKATLAKILSFHKRGV